MGERGKGRETGTAAGEGGVQNGLSVLGWRLRKLSLSGFHTIVGLTTGVLTITGALVAIPDFFKPPRGKGEVVAIVQDSTTDKTISDATVEILNGQNAVLTTVTSNWFGKAHYPLEEGQYRVRVSHPKFRAEVQPVYVRPGETAEIHVRLRPGSSAPIEKAARVIKEGVNAIRRLFD